MAATAQPALAAATEVECGAPATRVHAIQGAGRSSPLLGREDVVVEAVAVGVFPGFPDGLGGFFVQEEDADVDGDPATSEGLFVFDGGLGVGVEVGDRVRVKEGYFENFEGEVESIDEANGRITVMINIFGRSTPVELEHWQVESV